MEENNPIPGLITFIDLEVKYGRENAVTILRTLEQFEGVVEARVAKLTSEDRLQNVFRLMRENMQNRTRH